MLLLLSTVTTNSTSQTLPDQNKTTLEKEKTVIKPLSDEDKNAIIGLFKIINPKYYRLEIKRETYGGRKLSSTELSRIASLKRMDEETHGTVILFWDKDINAVTIYVTDGTIISAAMSSNGPGCGNPFLKWLGKPSTYKLMDLIGKQIKNPDIIIDPCMITNPAVVK